MEKVYSAVLVKDGKVFSTNTYTEEVASTSDLWESLKGLEVAETFTDTSDSDKGYKLFFTRVA